MEGLREASLFHLKHVKCEDTRIMSRHPIHHDHTDQCNNGTNEEIQSQLHRGIFARLYPAPNCNEQVHREHRDLIEEKQHEQIQRNEDAEHATGEDKQERKEFAWAILNARHYTFIAPGDEYAGEHNHARQENKRRADAIHAKL